MEKIKKLLAVISLLALATQGFLVRIAPVLAYSGGVVVINEVAWAGSGDSAGDEWIELFNNTNEAVDLTGWYVEDDGSTHYTIKSGTVAAKGYFVIEDNEQALSTIQADAVISLSLANTGDRLVLYDNLGNQIDTINGSGGVWYGGDSTSKASMERIDPKSNDLKDNFASAKAGNGAKGKAGTDTLGTPGGINSNYAGGGPEVVFKGGTVNAGSLNVAIEVTNVTDLYAYGFEINYDPAVLAFDEAAEGSFLKKDNVQTALNAGLKNGEEGVVVVGNARLINPATGVTGTGKLLDLHFDVISQSNMDTVLSFGATSFLSDSKQDIQAKFEGSSVKTGIAKTGKVTDLKIGQGDAVYSLKLSWSQGAEPADSYLIKRKSFNGSFVNIGSTTSLNFTDNDSLVGGGKILPGVDYSYHVIAVNGGVAGEAVSITGKETRGFAGDSDRNNRVDGRDIERLARAYASGFGDEEFDQLVDNNFDGVIDGADLINIGANFGLSS